MTNQELIDFINSVIDSLNTKITEKNNYIPAAQATIDGYNMQINFLVDQIAAANAAIDEYNTNISQCNEIITILQNNT